MSENVCVFESTNIIDALEMVKSTLGSDAVIVDTKKITPFLGFGREKIRITAVKKDNNLKMLNEISRELSELKKSIEEFKKREQYKKYLSEFIMKGISYQTASNLSDIIDNDKKLIDFVCKTVIEKNKEETKSRIFTGPWGCGKTGFTVNLSIDLKKRGREVCFIYTDIRKEEEKKYIKNLMKKNDIEFVYVKNEKEIIKKINSFKSDVIVDLSSDGFDLRKIIKNSKSKAFICAESIKVHPALKLKNYYKDEISFDAVITKTDEADMNLKIFDAVSVLSIPVSFISALNNNIIEVREFDREVFIKKVLNELLSFSGGKK